MSSVHAEVEKVAPVATESPEPRSRRGRLDGFDLLVLLVFALVSVWVLGLDLWQVIVHGRSWTGTDGSYIVDQMQYLSWIRDASHHVLAGNLFVLGHTTSDYFQPVITISGLITALGVAPWLALLLWKPVAVLAGFAAARAFARRNLVGLWPRRSALVLTLFFGSFTVVYGSFGVVGDLFPGFLTWGYTFSLISIAALAFAVLAYERARAGSGRIWLPGLLGAIASALHPWQGETLILIVIGAELVMWRSRCAPRPRLLLPALTIAMSAAPLLYYAILGRADSSWGLAREASKHTFSLLTIVLALLPLLIPAALAYRKRPQTFLELLTKVWPAAALVVYVLSATELSATPLHAFSGITFPLSVLAVQGLQAAGWNRLRHPRLIAAVAIALVTIPATVWELHGVSDLVTPTPGNPNLITNDEQHALDYLARSPQPGGVLTRFYLGTVVPAQTDRRTYVGNCLWSEPDCGGRAKITEDLLEGALSPTAARSLVLGSGARFVLGDCTSVDLRRTLAPILASVARFGCASVYTVRSPAAGSRRNNPVGRRRP
ncbi:MAG TPA: hypothetical protein VNR66_04035 [Solirubrobacteraceae bacterium]|nr:hypothetical protein [Solirubrobacteraceae bacterium]